MGQKFKTSLVIFTFLCVQMLSFLHISDYGVEKHEHNGEVCEIYLNVDHSKLAFGDDILKLDLPELLALKVILPEELNIRSNQKQSFYSRAPPIFS